MGDSEDESEQGVELESLGYFFIGQEMEVRGKAPVRLRLRLRPEDEDAPEEDGGDAPEGGKEDGRGQFLLLDIEWPPEYPAVPPVLSLDDEHNQILARQHREALLAHLMEEAAELEGEAMTLSIVNAARERLVGLREKFVTGSLWEQASERVAAAAAEGGEEGGAATQQGGGDGGGGGGGGAAAAAPKEKLTKAQKNRNLKFVEAGNKLRRGWDWVSLISHLSKTADR